jgi:hypothetical protein
VKLADIESMISGGESEPLEFTRQPAALRPRVSALREIDCSCNDIFPSQAVAKELE